MVLYPYSPSTGGMRPNMMFSYPVPSYFMPPPGSPYSGSPMNQSQFMFPPPYAVAYYHPDMFPQEPQAEAQNMDNKEGVEQA